MSADQEVGIGWYAAALAAYVVLGVLTKSVVLNWVVGPLFPLLVLYLLPRGVSALRRRTS